MGQTVVKSVRLDQVELETVERLLRRFKRYRSEADLLHHACILGLRDMAIEAGGSGTTPYAGLDPNELADDAEQIILRLCNFLITRGRLPALLAQLTQLAPVAPPSSVQPVATPPDVGQRKHIAIDDTAADDVEGLSGGFLDD